MTTFWEPFFRKMLASFLLKNAYIVCYLHFETPKAAMFLIFFLSPGDNPIIYAKREGLKCECGLGLMETLEIHRSQLNFNMCDWCSDVTWDGFLVSSRERIRGQTQKWLRFRSLLLEIRVWRKQKYIPENWTRADLEEAWEKIGSLFMEKEMNIN